MKYTFDWIEYIIDSIEYMCDWIEYSRNICLKIENMFDSKDYIRLIQIIMFESIEDKFDSIEY